MPYDGLDYPTLIYGGGRLSDGTILTVLGNWYGLRAIHSDAAGNLLGTARFWAPSLYVFGLVTATVDAGGDVLVVGSSGSGYWLMRFDGTTGLWRWKAPFTWRPDAAHSALAKSATVDGRGDVLVTGVAQRATSDVATFKLDGQTGAVLWGPVFFDTGPDDFGGTISLERSGDPTVVCWAGASPGGHLSAVKYRGTTGVELWRFESMDARATSALAREKDGSLLLAAARSDAAGFVLMEISSAGVVRFRSRVDDVDLTWADLTIALGPEKSSGQRSVFLAATTATEHLAWSLSARDGALLWRASTPVDADAYSVSAPTIASTPEGNLLVLRSESLLPRRSLTTLSMLRGTDGVLAWGPLLFPQRRRDLLRSLLTDSSGDPFVLAAGYDSLESPPALTFARVHRADGSFLAGPLDLPGGISAASPRTVLVDPRGDVVVLVDAPPEQASAWEVFKLDGTTGAVRWGPVPLPINFEPRRIGLDAHGDVLWAADTYLESGSAISYGKLRSDDGQPVWGPFVSESGTSLAGLAVAGDDLGVLARTWSGNSALLEVRRIRGTDGAVTLGPIPVTTVSTSYSGDTQALLYAAGVFAVCTEKTALVDAVSGAVRWVNDTAPDAIACTLDSHGNVFRSVTSYGDEPGTRVLKLSAGTGETLWTTFGAGLWVARLAVDAAGDLVMASRADAASSSGAAGLDVRKLSGAAGSLVWGPVRWDDPLTFESFASDLAITPRGDVVVVGSAQDSTAPRTLLLRLSDANGWPTALPVLFGGQGAANPTSLALSGEAPVVGLYSSSIGAAVVSWPAPPPPLAGDVNGDLVVDVQDVFALINFLFAGAPYPIGAAAADVNGDGVIDVADVFFLINELFAGGSAPQLTRPAR